MPKFIVGVLVRIQICTVIIKPNAYQIPYRSLHFCNVTGNFASALITTLQRGELYIALLPVQKFFDMEVCNGI